MTIKASKNPLTNGGKEKEGGKKCSKKKKRNRVEKIMYAVNIPYHICCHLLGETHSMNHRMGAGLLVMAMGVGIAKFTAGFHVIVVHFCGDMLGYFIHAIGTIPFAEAAIPKLIATVNKGKDEEEEEDLDDEKEANA